MSHSQSLVALRATVLNDTEEFFGRALDASSIRCTVS